MSEDKRLGGPCSKCNQHHPSSITCEEYNKITRREIDKVVSLATNKANKENIKPHIQRVIDEQIELNKKLVKLIQFTTTDMYRKLCVAQRDMLIHQMRSMLDYNNILADRIGHSHD